MFESRRNGQRDERRRRVLTEEVVSGGSKATRNKSKAQGGTGDDASSAYSEDAALDRQLRVTDFIPQRNRWFAAIAVGGMLSVGGVVAAHFFFHSASASGNWSAEAVRAIAPLELGKAGSVGSWLSAALLGLSAAFCLIIFALRRHRRDDYRGRYRVWISTACMALVASLCSVAAVHQVFAALVAKLTGWQATDTGYEWWLAPAGLLIAVQAVRLVLEVRRSRTTTALLVGGMLAFVLTLLALPFGPLSGMGGAALAGGATLVASLALMLTSVSYSRRVVLEIEGLLPQKVEKPTRKTEEGTTKKSQASSGKTEKNQEDDASADLPSKQVEKTALRVAAEYEDYDEEEKYSSRRRSNARVRKKKQNVKPQADEYDDEDDLPHNAGNRKLSKSARKQMRKLKSQQRDAA